MAKLAMAEILEKAGKMRSKEKKIEFLRQHHSKALHEVLAYGYDPRVKWEIPEEDPPYTPLSDQDGAEEAGGMLYQEARKFYLFVARPGFPTPNQMKREQLFIQLLETVHPKDAELVLLLKKKQLPTGITRELIEEAYGVYNG